MNRLTSCKNPDIKDGGHLPFLLRLDGVRSDITSVDALVGHAQLLVEDSSYGSDANGDVELVHDGVLYVFCLKRSRRPGISGSDPAQHVRRDPRTVVVAAYLSGKVVIK